MTDYAERFYGKNSGPAGCFYEQAWAKATFSVAIVHLKFYADHDNTPREGLELEVRSEVVDGVAMFRIAGRFDAEALTCQVLQSGIDSAIGAGAPRIIFDMREVGFITSAGLRVVVMTAKRAAAAKGGLSIFGVQPAVNEVFEISGLTKIIPIASDETEARSKFGA